MLGLTIILTALGLAAGASAKEYIVEFGNRLRSRDLAGDGSVKVVKSFASSLFTGAVIDVATDADVARLAAQAANFWPNHAVVLDKPLDVQTFVDDVAAGSYSTHHATGVDRLHASGILGQGVKVAVVDSGVWYKHPALGGGFGPGFKVAGGWDFVGNTSSLDEPKKPNGDPLDTPAIGHGTHVAGIIAARSDNFVGVAPNCTLLAYKVMGAYEGTDSATLIDAWLRAHDDGADVITTSISASVGWQDNALAAVVSRIVLQGVVMTMSAGNNGAEGAFFGGEAGSAPDVLAVASVQASVAPATPYRLTITTPDGASNTATSGYLPADDLFPPDVKDWPVVALNLDSRAAADACQPYPAGTRNLTGAVALVRRGTCSFVVKQKNLQALGARYVLVYNDDRALTNPGTTDPGSTLAMITAEAGRAIIAAIAAGANVTADFSQGGGEVGVPDRQSGSTPNTFSSWAATYDLLLKPDVAAPGGNIFSTWPENSYMVQSGTSMATPYIAGIAALYISAFGGRGKHGTNFAVEFNRRLAAAGMSLPWYNGTAGDAHFLAPPVQMGSGLVNASRVLYADTVLDTARLNLNDTTNFRGVHDVTVTNNGPAAVAYNFALEPAAGFEVQSPHTGTFNTWGILAFSNLAPKEMVPDVRLPEPFSLGPGESRKVTLEFANPAGKGWNATLIPMYSGKVLVSGDNGDRLALPYMGVASSLYENKKVFKTNYPSSFSGTPWKSIDVKSNYTFNLTTGVRDFPFIITALDWGVRELRWDVFEPGWPESKWTYPPSVGFIGSVTYYTGPRDPDFGPPTDLTAPAIANQTAPFPATLLARQGNYSLLDKKWWWLGRLANGSQIAPGNYTMRMAASRPMADLSSVDGWEVWRREIQVLPMN